MNYPSLKKGTNFCPENRINKFDLFIDLHHFIRKPPYFAIQKEKNAIQQEVEDETEGTPKRPGKYININNKSTFYPVETQGHFICTFLQCVQDLKRLDLKKRGPHPPQQNLSREEEKGPKIPK